MTIPRKTDYDRIAPGYDRRYAEHSFAGVAATLDAHVPDGAHVLEIGCGTGHWLAHLGPRVAAAIGVDPSRAMLSRARGTRVFGRGEDLPFCAGVFDRALAVLCIHHVEARQRCVADVRRVLAPGGAFLVINLDPHDGRDRWWIYDWFPEVLPLDRARYPSMAWVRDEMARAGFARVSTFVAQEIAGRVDAEEAFARGMVEPTATSQLAILSPDEYARGVARLRAAMAAGPVELAVDLRLWCTIGWAPTA